MRRITLIFAFSLALAGCATTRPDGAPVLDELRIVGNEALSDQEIEDRILLEGSSPLPFTHPKFFDETVLEGDLRRILRFYRARGFYKARIVERTVVQSGEDRVDVVIRVEEGPPTRLSDLEISGLEALPPAIRNQVLAKPPLREGDVFEEEKWDQLKELLGSRLREAGYAQAEVVGQAEVILSEDRAQALLAVTPGVRYRFGTVFVGGVDQVPRGRILALAREQIAEGAWFSESALIEAERRIFDLGVFSAVQVTRGVPNPDEGTVPVVVSVREAPFRTLRAGVGLGGDLTRQELPRASFEWTNRNFFGGLRRLSFDGRAAVVLIDFDLRGVAASTQLGFQQPFLFGKDLTLTSSLGFERGVETSYTYNAGTAEVGLPWRISRTFTFTPSYNFSVFRLFGPAADAARRTGQQAILDECSIAGELCQLAYLEQRATYDRRDNVLEPSRGFLLSISLQEGAGFLGGNFDFVRLLPELRFYLPVGRHVLAARALAGFLLTAEGEESSVLTRFYLGGGASHRGFGNRQLSPQAQVSLTEEVDGETVVTGTEYLAIGGNGMLAASLEARLNLWRNFGLVLFTDIGQVEPEVADLRLDGFQIAVGVGGRYRSPVGPVRVDVAYLLSKPEVPVRPLDDLSEVMQPDLSRFGLFISIGEAF